MDTNYNITRNQFYRILTFLIISTNIKVNEAPSYIIEKYSKLIGNPEDISDIIYTFSGIHQSIITYVENEYTSVWKHEINKFVRHEKIRDIIKNKV